MLKNIAVIPARSGSKGLPNKNIKLLNGKPLLVYSIEAAVKSKMFDEIVVSTDSKEYAEIAKSYGANVPFLRSKKNSSDTASSWDVALEVLAAFGDLQKKFDTVCLLQPTSPLREASDIIGAYSCFVEKNATTVIGVCETDHSPLWSNVLATSLSMDFFISDKANKPRQELDKFYRINGAIYIVDVKHIQSNKNIYVNSFAFIMDRLRSVDIDSELDFIIAEAIIKNSSIAGGMTR